MSNGYISHSKNLLLCPMSLRGRTIFETDGYDHLLDNVQENQRLVFERMFNRVTRENQMDVLDLLTRLSGSDRPMEIHYSDVFTIVTLCLARQGSASHPNPISRYTLAERFMKYALLVEIFLTRSSNSVFEVNTYTWYEALLSFQKVAESSSAVYRGMGTHRLAQHLLAKTGIPEKRDLPNAFEKTDTMDVHELVLTYVNWVLVKNLQSQTIFQHAQSGKNKIDELGYVIAWD